MLSDKKNRKSSNVSAEPGANQNRINEGTSITGDIESTGFFRVDGTINGNVRTPSKVVLGKKGVITGTLNCEQADIEGTFEGTLTVTGLLMLRATARINGEVVVGKLSVEPGAIFDATCAMGNDNSKETLSKTSQKSDSHFDRSNRSKKTGTEQLN